jgi:SAM-dependent methyltransferase
MRMYRNMAPWYALLDPVADHEDEAQVYTSLLRRAIDAPRTLLELGAGAGNNAWHLKRDFACTLADVAAEMLDLSRARNPECEHVEGDMRTMRLGRNFDAVLVHDAIVYMTTEAELEAAATTAFVHTRPGGAAIFAPDCLRETFREQSDDHEGADGERALRMIEWMWDPDPADSVYTVDYAFLLRDRDGVQAFTDRHLEGLFDRATWLDVLARPGYTVESVARPLPPEELGGAYCEELFLCRRPHS